MPRRIKAPAFEGTTCPVCGHHKFKGDETGLHCLGCGQAVRQVLRPREGPGAWFNNTVEVVP